MNGLASNDSLYYSDVLLKKPKKIRAHASGIFLPYFFMYIRLIHLTFYIFLWIHEEYFSDPSLPDKVETKMMDKTDLKHPIIHY